jgi:hypothetical protein
MATTSISLSPEQAPGHYEKSSLRDRLLLCHCTRASPCGAFGSGHSSPQLVGGHSGSAVKEVRISEGPPMPLLRLASPRMKVFGQDRSNYSLQPTPWAGGYQWFWIKYPDRQAEYRAGRLSSKPLGSSLIIIASIPASLPEWSIPHSPLKQAHVSELALGSLVEGGGDVLVWAPRVASVDSSHSEHRVRHR